MPHQSTFGGLAGTCLPDGVVDDIADQTRRPAKGDRCGQPPVPFRAATTQILQGPSGSEIKTGGFNQPDNGDGWRLWNLAPIMPAGKDYSRITKGSKELIDHVSSPRPY
jgi:hypothetical protein